MNGAWKEMKNVECRMQNETRPDSETGNVKGLYVHIPFCDGKCFYCAFYSLPYKNGLAQRYLRALAIEFKKYPPLIPETIFFGGGTPSLLSIPELEILCNLIKKNISTDALKEWTVECNPRSLTAEKLALFKKAGVNRISLGAQSFDDSALKWLGRRHNAADIYEAARMIKSAGFDNFGIDLIACIPGFKSNDWRKTLDSAIALKPKHISVYALTREEGSQLAQAVEEKHDMPLAAENCSRPRPTPSVSRRTAKAGLRPVFSGVNDPGYNSASHHQINLLTEDEEIETLDIACDLLAKANYHRYEISNYSQPGFECLHNLSCWRGEEYIGLGPAAASHVGLKRWANLPDLEKYLDAIENGKEPPCTMDVLTEDLKKTERIVFGLRMSEGISEATGKICEKTLVVLDEQGLVLNADGRWRLTERGFHLADYVGRELLAGTS